MNTLEAFKYVIHQSDCHQRTKIRHSSITKYRNWCRGIGNNAPTLNKIEDILREYGAKKVVEEKWNLTK
jgi:hypothetical protein